MLRLDHNRALTQIAQKLVLLFTDIEKLTVWGKSTAPAMYAARPFCGCRWRSA